MTDTTTALDNTFAVPPKSDKYRKGVPPAFAESKDKYYQDELTKLERIFDLTYDDVQKVSADGSVLKASIKEERTLRVTEDEALAQKITTLTATVDTDRANTAASLQVEQTARATKDEALAQQITTLDAAYKAADSTLDAKVTQEITARTTATDALAQSITTLTATVTNNDTSIKARVSTEETARANADGALSSRIDTLTATVGTNTASITSEQTARANADSALGTRIDNLTTTVNGNTTAISSETTARTTADTALGTRIDTLTTTVNGNTTAISSETTARTNADSALGTRIDSLTTRVGNNESAITSEQTARANGDSANATSISNLSTTVNGHTTSISQNTSSINGLQAKWGVSINANGRVSGLTLNSGADSKSSFDVQADYFNIYNPNGTRAIYWDGSTLVVRGDILANNITASAVNNLGNGVVNRPVVSNPTVYGQGTFYTNQNAGNFSVTSSEGYVSNELRGFTVYIPTGLYVDSSWSVASTTQYLATATIAGGTSQYGGMNGYGRCEVVIGDGLYTNGAYNDPVDNQIYIRYQFEPSGNGGAINVTAISWKIVRV